MNYAESVEAMKWIRFPVLSDGFVCLVDVMGSEAAIVQAARASYGKDQKSSDSEVSEDDVTLIRYLMRNWHTTPFEMVEFKFFLRVPMDCWRQWVRHRTASINEYSTRYKEAIDSADVTDADEWRAQSTDNKQGSTGFVTEWPASWNHDPEAGVVHPPNQPPVNLNRVPFVVETIGDYLTQRQIEFHQIARDLYKERLAAGVAREQARKDLPLSTYTEAYWKIDLHNLLHFLRLRLDGHAQQEIREYAETIGTIVEWLMPNVWQAFIDYRKEAVTLSRLDTVLIGFMYEGKVFANYTRSEMVNEVIPLAVKKSRLPAAWAKERCRERDECLTKLELLGLIRNGG